MPRGANGAGRPGSRKPSAHIRRKRARKFRPAEKVIRAEALTCPECEKKAFLGEKEASAASLRAHGHRMRTYRCRDGKGNPTEFWHYTSQTSSQARRARNWARGPNLNTPDGLDKAGIDHTLDEAA
jgi:hypothetical protein